MPSSLKEYYKPLVKVSEGAMKHLVCDLIWSPWAWEVYCGEHAGCNVSGYVECAMSVLKVCACDRVSYLVLQCILGYLDINYLIPRLLSEHQIKLLTLYPFVRGSVPLYACSQVKCTCRVSVQVGANAKEKPNLPNHSVVF